MGTISEYEEKKRSTKNSVNKMGESMQIFYTILEKQLNDGAIGFYKPANEDMDERIEVFSDEQKDELERSIKIILSSIDEIIDINNLMLD